VMDSMDLMDPEGEALQLRAEVWPW
jgi:hypothetical protein